MVRRQTLDVEEVPTPLDLYSWLRGARIVARGFEGRVVGEAAQADAA